MNINQVSKLFGSTNDRIKQQYADNAKILRQCEEQAKKTGKKYRGKTADQWGKFAEQYEQKAI